MIFHHLFPLFFHLQIFKLNKQQIEFILVFIGKKFLSGWLILKELQENEMVLMSLMKIKSFCFLIKHFEEPFDCPLQMAYEDQRKLMNGQCWCGRNWEENLNLCVLWRDFLMLWCPKDIPWSGRIRFSSLESSNFGTLIEFQYAINLHSFLLSKFSWINFQQSSVSRKIHSI